MIGENGFSVLMSVYKNDDAACLQEALASIFAQSCPPAEVVLVADGEVSPQIDLVLELYKAKCKIIRLPHNAGLGAALQKGLGECSHPLVARMDSDDISRPQRFELQLSAFAKDKNLTLCGGAIEEIDFKTKRSIAVRKTPLTDTEIKRFIKTRCPFNHVTVMFKKDDILSCGGYLPFHFLEDYYLWARLAAAGKTMRNLPDVLVDVRSGAQMYARRGGYKYFKSNKALFKEMYTLGLINYPLYIFNLIVRFSVQVVLSNSLRGLFYRRVLR